MARRRRARRPAYRTLVAAKGPYLFRHFAKQAGANKMVQIEPPIAAIRFGKWVPLIGAARCAISDGGVGVNGGIMASQHRAW